MLLIKLLNLITHNTLFKNNDQNTAQTSFGLSEDYEKFPKPKNIDCKEYFVQSSTYQTFDLQQSTNLPTLTKKQKFDEAVNYITSKFNTTRDQISVTSVYDTSFSSFYFKPLINSIQVKNAEANLNLDNFGKVMSFGEFWIKPTSKNFKKKKNLSPLQSLFIVNDRFLNFKFDQNLMEVEKDFITFNNGYDELLIQDSIIIKNLPFIKGGNVNIAEKFYRTQDEEIFNVWEVSIPMLFHRNPSDDTWYTFLIDSSTGHCMGYFDSVIHN
ncbi:hypothetical protein HK099_003590 [Clydaea vesicula]|uniref:Uncharacterized protein n=1 Tax=Clydaea vesicula TaxID=447962 RepID=A0AAD5U4Q4_9FUNG|nr:hypothetical protein HK099_003590 [Clydaea vesicula]KAJ3390489.1 hypothetical protein HDU92_000422 [Lobulomyces angularis]